MPTQPTLFETADLQAALAAEADAINQADDHADVRWRYLARLAVLHCAATLPDFTSDDVWAWLHGQYPDHTTHEPSALGPVFLWAAKQGAIEKTGTVRHTVYKRRHRDLTVWKAKP